MSKIKQKYTAYITAHRQYNKRKVALKEEFSKELNTAALEKDIDRFKVLSKDMMSMLGAQYKVTINQIIILHGLDWEIEII